MGKKSKYLTVLFALIFSLPAFAYEDCIISTDGKMTDISIQHNDIIDVFPLVTITNDKNTLIVHPLKTGSTKFSILKNNKDKHFFEVTVTEETTTVKPKEGFDILNIDCPPGSYEYFFDLDTPPFSDDEDYSDLDEPPVFNGNGFNTEPPKLRGE